MEKIPIKLVETGIFFLFIFLSGFWLSRSRKPYHTIIFNIHKLIGLATGIFLIITVYRVHQVSPLESISIVTIVVTVLLFIMTVVAGGLLSIAKPMPGAVKTVHHLLPYIITLSTAATLYNLLTS